MEAWLERFISLVKEDLRERVKTLDEVWAIMIFSPEKQDVAESAARVAYEFVQEKNREIVNLEIRIVELEEESSEQEKELARRREKINELTDKLYN